MAQKKRNLFSPLMLILTILLFVFSVNLTVLADTEAAKVAFNKGLEFEKANNNVAALASYQLCLKEDPSYIDAYINIGTMKFAEKKYDDALTNFKAATEKDSKNVDAFTNLGKVQYKLKKYAEAEASFKSSIALKEDAGTYKELGKVYYKKKNYPEVINAFTKSHSLGGGDHITQYMLGKAYQKTGKKADAIKALKKSASIKSDYYLAHSTLGGIYASDDKNTAAAAAYKKAMNTTYKKRYNAAYNYAVQIETADPENYKVNIANWQKFIKMAKGKPNAKNQLATATGHVKELQEALEESKLQ